MDRMDSVIDGLYDFIDCEKALFQTKENELFLLQELAMELNSSVADESRVIDKGLRGVP